jgi:outer membrane scaffolding protein for murein synthesis (MipA/OmpV family)
MTLNPRGLCPLGAALAFLAASASLRVALTLLAASAPLPALAELTNDPMIGPAVRSRPAYDGADSQRGEAVPVIRYLGEPWFIRSTQGVLEGGARLKLAPGLHLGAQVAYEPGRKTSESAFLESRGVADVDVGASIGAQVEWDQHVGPAPVTVLARVRHHTESDRGTQADLRLSVGVFKRGRVGLGLFTQATWASSEATRSLYGITPQQSGATGLAAYSPDSGLLFGSAGLLWSIDIAPKWVAVGNFELRRLGHDARRSPLVQRSTNHYLSAGIAYRF